MLMVVPANRTSMKPTAATASHLASGKCVSRLKRTARMKVAAANGTSRMGGTFERATGAPPFDLPPAYAANRAKIDPKVAYDFVTTNDIIGGNSGSPVIDKQGRVIGAAFDGNIHSLGGNYGYDGSINRTVVVSTAAVQEALEKIYPAPNLVAELKGK